MNYDTYTDPLVTRYSSQAIQAIFTESFKFRTWRKCWIALAEAQRELGLGLMISEKMIEELRCYQDEINYEVARKKEEEIRHEVMAHVYAYGLQCPQAEKIIHLGETSQFVGCNTDLIQQREALTLIKKHLLRVIVALTRFAEAHAGVVTLAYTHLQAAQPTTVGKRHTLYIQDLLMDLDALEIVANSLRARGAKGTTGTQASHLELFGGDHEKVKALDLLVAKKLGFADVFPVTGQTYPRKLDTKIVEVLAGLAASAHKFAVDLRLLSSLKVQEEPFAADQTGSSAMPYKRNPMRSERLTSLARMAMHLPAQFYEIQANQWLERTLDDSAIRRLEIPQAFLLADAILRLYLNIASQMVIHPAQIAYQLRRELPFLATETILMECVKRGKSRQTMHELIQRHAFATASQMNEGGTENDLLARLAADPEVPMSRQELEALLSNPGLFAGRAEAQTREFLSQVVRPRLASYGDFAAEKSEGIRV